MLFHFEFILFVNHLILMVPKIPVTVKLKFQAKGKPYLQTSVLFQFSSDFSAISQDPIWNMDTYSLHFNTSGWLAIFTSLAVTLILASAESLLFIYYDTHLRSFYQ